MQASPSPFSSQRARLAAGTLGLRLFLLSLGVLFAVSVIGYLVIRLAPGAEPVGQLPPLPAGLWLSTAILLASSGTMQVALMAVREDRPRRLRSAMVATTLAGFAFLAVQLLCWIEWAGSLAESLGQTQRVFLLTSFYVLTGLHAAHVIGGLIPLAVVTQRAFRNRYSSDDHAGVVYCAMYWHFLDGVWIVLFLTLLIGTR